MPSTKDEHLAGTNPAVAPKTPDGCGACLAQGTKWIDLHKCITCGEVVCCSSGQAHSRKHFEQTGHAVVVHYPNPSWTWCWAHNAYVT